MTSNPSSTPTPKMATKMPAPQQPQDMPVGSTRTMPVSKYTDPLNLAKRFLKAEYTTSANQQTLHYHRSRWLRWDGYAWTDIESEILSSEITEFVEGQFADWNYKGPRPQMSTKTTSMVLRFLQDLVVLPAERQHFTWLTEPASSEPDRNYITFQNGILHVPSYLAKHPKAFQPLTPEWFSSVVLSYDFVPGATAPLWEKFVSEVLPQADLAALLQELFGYCLTPDTQHEKAFLWHGAGRNGKSTAADVLTWMVGDKNVSHVSMERFADQFALVASENKLVNIMAEITKVPAAVEGVFKEFTSGKPVSTRNLYGKTYSMSPTARCVCTANTLPPIKDHTDGFWRRLVLVPFKIQIPLAQVDTQLGHKLRPELPGIALWALQGLERLRKQEAFTVPAASADALAEYRAAGNPLGAWLLENFVCDPASELPLRTIISAFKDTCMDDDKTLDLPSISQLKAELERLFPATKCVRKIPTTELAAGIPPTKKADIIKGLRERSDD